MENEYEYIHQTFDTSKRGWKKAFKEEWLRQKLINLDFSGIKDKFKLADRLMPKLDPLILAMGHGLVSKSAFHTTGWIVDEEGGYLNHDPRNMREIIKFIDNYMESNEFAFFELGEEHIDENGDLETNTSKVFKFVK
ncbi:MAG: hypothetical protein V3U92_19515 [Cellulophaga sp.]